MGVAYYDTSAQEYKSSTEVVDFINTPVQNMAYGVDKYAKFNDIYLDLPKMVPTASQFTKHKFLSNLQIYYLGWYMVHHLIRQEGGPEAMAASKEV